MAKDMEGQLSLFDISTGKKRPCDYGFKRYVGQKVYLSAARDTDFIVKEIEPYYTIVIDNKGIEWVGTPTTMGPVNKDEWEKWP